MLPALTNRYAPALAVMQLIAADTARPLWETEPNAGDDRPTVEVGTPVRNAQALNDYFFGSRMSVTETMDQVVGYLNGKLEIGRDGENQDVVAGNLWRERVLTKDIDVGSKDDFSIPKPDEDGVSYRRVAQIIQSSFDLDALSRDGALMRMLEDAVGFALDGMTVADLIKAFAEPDGAAAEKVRAVLSEGLAGQTGSKVMQRLEAAAAEPFSVDEALDRGPDSPVDVVDEETKAEDAEDVKAAKAREKLDEVAKVQDTLQALLDAASPSTSADEAAALATELIQALGATAEGPANGAAEAALGTLPDEPPSNAATGTDDDVTAATEPAPGTEAASRTAPSGDLAADDEADTLDMIVQAYRDALRDEDSASLPQAVAVYL